MSRDLYSMRTISISSVSEVVICNISQTQCCERRVALLTYNAGQIASAPLLNIQNPSQCQCLCLLRFQIQTSYNIDRHNSSCTLFNKKNLKDVLNMIRLKDGVNPGLLCALLLLGQSDVVLEV